MKLSLLPPLLAVLAGCGGYVSVRVPHQLPEGPNAAVLRPHLGALHLVVKAPDRPEEEPLSGLAGELLGRSGPDMNFQALARQAALALSGPAARACSWQVVKGAGSPSALAGRLGPSALLVITPGRPAVSVKKEQRTAVQYDRKKQKQSVKSGVWAYSAELRPQFHLLAWPGGAVLETWADVLTVAEDRFDKAKPPEDWYAENEARLFSGLAGKLAARYSGRRADRFRPVFSVKGDEESARAADFAADGRWEEASGIWRARLSSGGWRDELGLAVAAELRKDYGEAEARYRRARELAAGDKAARPVRWDAILRDLEAARALPSAGPCGGDWFGVKTAVLPFSDETSSVDGPPLVRQLLFAQLKEAGYALQPLERTDELLRRRGYSDGGQLGAAKPEELAAWLGAGRLVYADITDFGEIMAGIYNRRMVKGSVRVWEGGYPELAFEESVVRVKAPKSLLGGLAGQLAKGLVERLKNRPLAYEAGIFARQAVENLPAARK